MYIKDLEMSDELTLAYLGEGGRLNFNQQHFQNITGAWDSLTRNQSNIILNWNGPKKFYNILDMISDAYIWYGAHKQVMNNG